MTDETDILIIGAGAAGLAAARELSAANFNVIVLEARDRIGGRIHTHLDSQLSAPVELGAEFVHGKPPETLQLADRAGIKLIELPNTHWYFRNALISKSREFWSAIQAVDDEIAKYKGHDESFAEFLDEYSRKHKVHDVRAIATLFVEGFHAAHADRISVLGLMKTNEAAAEIDDEKQFRPAGGYRPLVAWLHSGAVAHGASFRLQTVVREIAWHAGAVTVTSDTGEQFKARRLIVTLPLGVLQRNAVTFAPRLVAKEEAANKLAVGQVVKVMLRFRDRFWEEISLPSDDGQRADLKEFAFIHSPDELPATWWTQLPVRVPLLVGWAGGTRAEQLLEHQTSGHAHASSRANMDALLDKSLVALSHIFAEPVRSIEDQLLDFYTHDWATDPFSLGAYSYIPVGGLKAQAALSEPIENTIYFAGEAANKKGHHGTVQGALATGLRVAQLILQS
ncbi:MAG TPA: NAD(P)/FAD-dependent oxidoreductase [Pyrinomonadaceae bacterium]